MIVGDKFDAFLDCCAEAEFLEGTTQAGKTTVGIFKFLLEVAESPKKQHIISGLNKGTIEKNIITKDRGILDEWGILVEYNGNGTAQETMPHILFHPAPGKDKTIYVLGYDNKARWKNALGGQYGCVYIDEINIADIDFVREAAMRCDYLMATLNPDDPALPVYSEYVNRSRPLPEWADTTPEEILSELTQEAQPGWVHWFFTFDDNIALSPEKKEKTIRSVPIGTKQYKNKILGLRGKATGLVFVNFDRKKHLLRKAQVKELRAEHVDGLPASQRNKAERFVIFSAGLDTAYSSQSPDTIAMSFLGITNWGNCYVLDEKVYNNAGLENPLAPSDTVRNMMDFLERNRKEWGFARDVFIDSADQATIKEFSKYKRTYGSIYNFVNAWKKEKIIDRINNQLGWFADAGTKPCFYILDHCVNYTHELESYSWKEDKDNEPEDGNDHMINSVQYGWLPYEKKIGFDRHKKEGTA